MFFPVCKSEGSENMERKYFKLKYDSKSTLIIFTCTFFFLINFTVASSVEKDLLTPVQMKENLQFVKDMLINWHPNLYHAISKQEYELLYKNLVQKFDREMTPSEFYFIANQFIIVHKDAHTQLRYEYDSKILPFSGIWLPEGFGITGVKGDFPQLLNTRLLAIEGITMDKWFKYMSEIIPHENMDWVRVLGVEMILKQYVIEHFIERGDVEKVNLTIEKDGKVSTLFVPFILSEPSAFSPSNTIIDVNKVMIIRYMDSLSTAYVELLKCMDCLFLHEFCDKIDEFFEEVKKRSYKNIIIDLRRNVGGTTDFVFKIFDYMPGNEFKPTRGYGNNLPKTFEKYKQKPKQKMEMQPSLWKKSESDGTIELFRGKIYMLIGNKTFSSANWFAMVFKDNDLATLIGQRSGNAPCSYGAIHNYKLPYGNIEVIISTKYIIRPSGVCDTDALLPDVEIPLTLEDAFNGNDPVMKHLEKKLK